MLSARGRVRLAAALSLLVMASCAAPSPTPSVVPSASPSPAEGSASPSIEPSASASASASAQATAPTASLPVYGFQDILQIEVDRLPVRVAPLSHMPLATGWRDGTTEIGDVRLDTGDFVSVDLGPLHVGDTTWYRVRPAENAQLDVSSVVWDTKFDGPNGVEAGWIAAAEGDEERVSLFQEAVHEPFLDGLPLLVSATGDLETETFEGYDRYLIEWAYASVDEQPEHCGFYVALVTPDRTASFVILDQGYSGVGAFHEGVAEIGGGDGVPVVGEDFVPVFLLTASECTWSIRLEGVPHG
jgi:hypothetical protein